MDYSRLKEIGLSKSAAGCYQTLFDSGMVTASELQQHDFTQYYKIEYGSLIRQQRQELSRRRGSNY